MSQERAIEGISDVALHDMVASVLPFRTPDYISAFLEKLLGEGISQPSDLLRTSKEALEKKLSTHASFNFIEMADAMSLATSVEQMANPGRADKGKGDKRGGKGYGGSVGRRQRSRSPIHHGRRGRYDSRTPPRYRRGRRDGSRPHRYDDRRRNDRYDASDWRVNQNKPELWAAVEKGDQALVTELLEQGADPEEKHLGWSPLMKAAEEGHIEILQKLLEKDVDLEVVNKKGRSALSFAAAPSMKRPTATATLRLLLEYGADTTRKDAFGRTAKDHARSEKRDEAVAIFEEFEAKDKSSAHKPAGLFRMKMEPGNS